MNKHFSLLTYKCKNPESAMTLHEYILQKDQHAENHSTVVQELKLKDA